MLRGRDQISPTLCPHVSRELRTLGQQHCIAIVRHQHDPTGPLFCASPLPVLGLLHRKHRLWHLSYTSTPRTSIRRYGISSNRVCMVADL